ncbi:MAG: tetratricopeptide repeat protein [Gammaproteobacteria bacterium]
MWKAKKRPIIKLLCIAACILISSNVLAANAVNSVIAQPQPMDTAHKARYVGRGGARYVGGAELLLNRFVGDQTCAQCHPIEYHQWLHSHHALAMQVANNKTVLGDFNNTAVNYFGIITRFFKKNGTFYIHTQGTEGKYHDFIVKYTFGIDPLQQYLVEFPGGRLQAFSIAWDTHQERWFHLYGREKITFSDPLFWAKRHYNWNRACADCHSTHVKENYDITTNYFHTQFSAINVGCQACHGPGAKHLAWAKAQLANQTTHISNKGLTINYKVMSTKQFVEACAFCHSRRHAINPAIEDGTPLLNNYVPEILREHTYYVNGAIEDEDYEYGSFIQSKMYKAGVICSACHNPHTAKIKILGNGLCTQCHNNKPPKPRFAGLMAKNYDSPAHTHHPFGSPGAQCVNCHMPTKTYMQIHVRRDHYFRIPRPDLTIHYGIPNACNSCHHDQSPQWAQQYIEKWYGKNTFDDYSDIIEKGRAQQPLAENRLINLAKDKRQANIVRATALYLLQNYYSAASIQAMIDLSHDQDELVRMYAVGGLEPLSPEQKISVLTPLLTDSIRAVRIKTAVLYASIPQNLLNSAQQAAFNHALAEYKNSQHALLDTPEANFNLGLLAETQNNNVAAEKYYRQAIQMDKHFYPASQNLAIFYNGHGQNEKAEATLKQAIVTNPDQGQLYYSLGLLLAEEKKFDKSVNALAAAVKLMPNNAKAYYNYGLVLQHINKLTEAKQALLKAHQLQPNDPQILAALAQDER